MTGSGKGPELGAMWDIGRCRKKHNVRQCICIIHRLSVLKTRLNPHFNRHVFTLHRNLQLSACQVLIFTVHRIFVLPCFASPYVSYSLFNQFPPQVLWKFLSILYNRRWESPDAHLTHDMMLLPFCSGQQYRVTYPGSHF